MLRSLLSELMALHSSRTTPRPGWLPGLSTQWRAATSPPCQSTSLQLSSRQLLRCSTRRLRQIKHSTNSASATRGGCHCATRLARAETDEKLGVAAGHGDWRQSALTKLSKAPLTMRGGLVSVLVTMGVASAEAESAETALRFAGAVRGLERFSKKSPGVKVFFARTERAVETSLSRRERLETKLAATRAEARRGGVRDP